ncbi:hypothetical protein CSHISOI_00332, partial [Colletotrichum shisoi]
SLLRQPTQSILYWRNHQLASFPLCFQQFSLDVSLPVTNASFHAQVPAPRVTTSPNSNHHSPSPAGNQPPSAAYGSSAAGVVDGARLVRRWLHYGPRQWRPMTQPPPRVPKNGLQPEGGIVRDTSKFSDPSKTRVPGKSKR